MEFTHEEKLQAAYALNLCTVSVSQIIDYADITVLEQEYEAILNNLNLEYMPKDEALLDILKRLLETINFFRIQEGDKKFVEREYQQKMKNAIWSAVPNLSLLVAGGNPATMLFSAAAQIGIGYMNYRRNRAEYLFEQEEKLWKLRRTALEQFHTLQQQLFETAWRLADKYSFPDEFRLTERQIKQYNAVLMDSDEVRKYERLKAMQNRFQAYPPFWYYLGNTANAIANSDYYGLDESSKNNFRERAKEHFAYFHEVSKYNLLREDAISAACSLEYISLLDVKEDKEKIIQLTKNAKQMAGESFDIMQLCAMAYIKAGCRAEATEILRQLVNEQYNKTMNAQLLSVLYVNEYVASGSAAAKADYQLLQTRISPEYLFPFMEASDDGSREKLHEEFIKAQRSILKKKYRLILDAFMDKYEVLINRIIPLPNDFDRTLPDALYESTSSARAQRLQDIELLERDKEKKQNYEYEIRRISYANEVVMILRKMFDAICVLECVNGEQKRLELASLINKALENNASEIMAIDFLLGDAPDAKYVGVFEIYKKAQEITISDLAQDFFKALIKDIVASVESKKEMGDFVIAEENLIQFCQQEGFKEPEILYEHKDDIKITKFETPYIFLPGKLDKEAQKQMECREKYVKLLQTIEAKKDSVAPDKEKVEFYTQNDVRLDRYFYNKALQKYSGIRAKTLAVLDDKTQHDMDLIFTTEGIMPIIKGKGTEVVPYRKIVWGGNGWQKELLIRVPYGNPNLNMRALMDLIEELRVNAVSDK